ncbi:hypothetical protein [Pseudomonas silesiensis]|uniref:hypothetical protein n=1 Tax=Pseudomonas silesiensis TaxID=1853130 RepID=UPI0034D3EC3B
MSDLALLPPFGASQMLVQTKVSSRDDWRDTHVILERGTRYYFRATGKWWDAQIHCDANGYNRWYMDWAKEYLRCQKEGATWFTLIGAIEESTASLFVIGDGARWRDGWIAPKSGKLTAFANDITGMYWNNFASVTLEIWR